MIKKSGMSLADALRLLSRLINGRITFKGRTFQRATVVGIIAVIFMYIGVAGMFSAVLPLDINKGDTRAHVDYIWRVYNGEIPRLSDGLRYKPFNPEGTRVIQPQANHPPLFYMINAPFVGPFLERGDWQTGIGVARAINVFIGVLCILALAWAGWLFGGKRRELFAVALPAIAVMAYRFTTLNVVYGPDALLVLISTLTFVTMYKIIKNGLNRKYGIALMLLSVAGMSTKVGYLAILITSFLAILVAAFIHSTADRRRQILRAALYTGLILTAVAVVIGWFYYVRNYQTTGTWFRASPDDYSGGREYQSLNDVIFSGKFRGLFYEEIAQNSPLSIFITCFAAAGLLGLKRLEIKKFIKGKVRAALSILLLIAVLGVVAGQVTFAVGYGAINFRYLLPAILPIGLLLAYGLLEFKWARGQFVAGAAILMGATTLFPARSLIPGLGEAKTRLASFLSDAAYNGFSAGLVICLLLLFFLGAGLLAASLYKLSGTDKPKAANP